MPLKGPSVINANTTYAIDHSAQNNYGLGPSYASKNQLRTNAKAAAATPSIWWLVLFGLAVVLL